MKADLVQLENNIMKKIYFDGCSYTFGQSLELYCNSHDIFQHDRLSKYKFTESDLKFIKENRYTSIVSKHFEFDEVNKSIPGKSNGKILFDKNRDWKVAFGEYNTGRPCINGYSHKVYNYKPDW